RVSGAAGERLQPHRGGGRDVPDDPVGRMGWDALRLRLQPDAGVAAFPGSPPHDLRLRSRCPRRTRDRARSALLRLYRGKRLQLRGRDRRLLRAASRPTNLPPGDGEAPVGTAGNPRWRFRYAFRTSTGHVAPARTRSTRGPRKRRSEPGRTSVPSTIRSIPSFEATSRITSSAALPCLI